MNINFDRLRECITALKTVKGAFTMRRFYSHCGTPACVLGHHEAMYRAGVLVPQRLFPYCGEFDNENINCQGSVKYFGIDGDLHHELFGINGCGGACTPEDAIAYLEDFIKRREPAPRNWAKDYMANLPKMLTHETAPLT